MFMLDLLDNLPRLRLSDDQLKTIIWVMRECGTPDIPSFSALRKKQAQLTKDVNIQTVRHVSAMGNEFYMNHPAQLLALVYLLFLLCVLESDLDSGLGKSACPRIYAGLSRDYRPYLRDEPGRQMDKRG